MKALSLLNFIINHPLNKKNKKEALSRFFKWQISSYLIPYSVIYQYTEKSLLIINKGMTGATQNLYCGLHDYVDMTFVLHFLREEDLFVDIGANVGSYTVLSSAHVGARTISFEPVPSTLKNLLRNVMINRIEEKVQVFNMALGSKKGTLSFTSSLDTMNHVASEDDKCVIDVPVERLDDLLENQSIPVLLKVDVEGYETEVFRGALKTLAHNQLMAIIVELNGSGTRYGYNEESIHDLLKSFGFEPFLYDPKQRSLIKIKTFGSHNTIYIRNQSFVEQRLKSAQKVKILDTIL